MSARPVMKPGPERQSLRWSCLVILFLRNLCAEGDQCSQAGENPKNESLVTPPRPLAPPRSMLGLTTPENRGVRRGLTFSSPLSSSPAESSGASAAPSPSPSPEKICLACPLPATKGSLCDKHKRVSDNVYNDEKKTKEQDPERWKRFMAMRKNQGQDWVEILISAELTKGSNPGKGHATGSFHAQINISSVRQESKMTGEFHSKSMNMRMFLRKLREEWGWDAKEAGEEWKRLLAAAPKEHIIEHPTLPGRKMEEWLYVHDFDELVGSQGVAHASEVQLREKEKRNPKQSDIDEAEDALATQSLHFSDRLFSKMAGTATALQSVRASGSAIVDGSGKSFIFSDASSFREKSAAAAVSNKAQEKEKKEKKGKGKPFDIEQQLDSLDFRLKKRFDAGKKMCDDVLRDMEDFFTKEPSIGEPGQDEPRGGAGSTSYDCGQGRGCGSSRRYRTSQQPSAHGREHAQRVHGREVAGAHPGFCGVGGQAPVRGGGEALFLRQSSGG